MRLTAIIFDSLLVVVLAALTFVLTTYGDDTPRGLSGIPATAISASAVPTGSSGAPDLPVFVH